jgi:hypothetical protein
MDSDAALVTRLMILLTVTDPGPGQGPRPGPRPAQGGPGQPGAAQLFGPQHRRDRMPIIFRGGV